MAPPFNNAFEEAIYAELVDEELKDLSKRTKLAELKKAFRAIDTRHKNPVAQWCRVNFDATVDKGGGTTWEKKYQKQRDFYNKLCDGNLDCVEDRLEKYMKNVEACREKCKGGAWWSNRGCLAMANQACKRNNTDACKLKHMEGVIMAYCGVDKQHNVLPKASGKNDPACSSCMRQEPTTQAERIAAGVEKIPGQEDNPLVNASRTGSKIQPPSCWLQACEDGNGSLAADKFHPNMSAIKCLGLFNCSINVKGGVQGSVRLINDCANVPPPPPANAPPNRSTATRVSLPSSKASAQTPANASSKASAQTPANASSKASAQTPPEKNDPDDKSKDDKGKARKMKVLIGVVLSLACIATWFLIQPAAGPPSSQYQRKNPSNQ